MARTPYTLGIVRFSLFAAVLGLSGHAAAASWQLIESRSRAQTELDVASIVRKEGHASGWVQTTYSTLTSSESGTYFAYRSLKEHLRMHCAERTTTVLARAYFNDEGAEIAMIKGKGETRPVAPDTTEQRVMARMCNPNAGAESAKVGAAKRAAGAPVAMATAAPVSPVSTRYMDGPAVIGNKNGFIKAKAEAAGDLHSPGPASINKATAISEAAPAPAAGTASEPAADPHQPQKALALAQTKTTAPPNPLAKLQTRPASRESRQQVVARVLEERAQPAKGAGAQGHAASGGSDEHVHWAYDGEFAPYKWGDMKADYALCKSGSRQSPIDIRNPVVSEIEPIQFHYEDAPLKVSNNGHTIQVDYAPGSFIFHAGARYELVQFHFHTPSEERINGRTFDMVAHLVHKSAQGKLAVVAVLLAAGKEQPMLHQVWNAMPGTAGRTRERLDVMINARQLLPADPAFYSFMGSLTTPPCTEGVQWLVMKTPVEMSRDQIGHFVALYPMNARPLQAQNDRLIKAGK